MKLSTFAWVFGAAASVALGIAAQACSSSSSTGAASTGNSTSGGSHTSGATTGSSHTSGATTGTSGTTGVSGSTTAGSSGSCYTIATKTYPEDGGGQFCPFSNTVDGGPKAYCTHGEHCCETPVSANTPSTCEPSTTACITGSTDWGCSGTPDCNAGQVCCGTGKVDDQPACGTTPASIYPGSFTGSNCATACTAAKSTYVAWQVCSQDSECPSGQSCIPTKVKGNTIGACCSGTSPNWTCAFQAGSGTGTSTSAATTSTSAASTTAASTTTSGAGSSSSSH
jgi:hypothetical protein